MGEFYYRFRNLFYEEKEPTYASFYRKRKGKQGFLEKSPEGNVTGLLNKYKLNVSPALSQVHQFALNQKAPVSNPFAGNAGV
jgi:hypothetical protein